MTVIAWDGKTLAADKMHTSEGKVFAGVKVYKDKNYLIATCGTADTGAALRWWWVEEQAQIEKWPVCQKDDERWSILLIITPDKRILRFDREPYPIQIQDEFYAIGSGSHFATAAMALAKTATEAVQLASRFHPECGLGVDSITHDE